MKRTCTLATILLTLFSGMALTTEARKFYMAPNGNDSNNGSITAPFKTLNKVWTVIAAGDTVYLRGGTYEFNTAQYLQGKNGNATAGRINIWAYPGEKPNLTRSSTYNANTQQDLIYFEGNWFHWKGLEISWFDQKPGDYAWPAFRAGFTSNSIFEQIDYHHNGAGMSIRGNSNNNLFLNCDFHHNQDPYSDSPFDGADGIDLHYIAAGNTNTLKNCRAWWNADDGFDCWDNNGYVLIENCWAFYNGYIPGTFNPAGNGSGIKLGATANHPNTLLRTVRNCIAFKNRSYGIVENAAICKSDIFNNVVAQSGDYGFWFGSWGTNVATLRNNIGWNNPQNARLSVHDIHDHNTWNGGVTVNASDFLSTDDSQLVLPRKPDGSLPDITFLSLVDNSDLIDAGVNVGLPFNALAPDIAATENGLSIPGNLPPVVNAGTNISITLPLATVTLSGSATDPDGTVASLQWSKISGPNGLTISTPLLPITIVIGLVEGTYEFELLAVDNLGAVGRDTVTVTVLPLFPSNQPPVANAGPNKNITLPQNNVTVTGSGTDPDGTVVSYAWRKVAGPATFTIESPNQPQTVMSNLVQGTYRFELKVTDNQGATDLDTMRIIVNAAPPNQNPTANAGPDHNITLPANSVTATGSGNDPDGTINAYQWTKISGPSQFNITAPTQAQTTINNLVQGTYTFSLTVTDNQGATAADTMSITVNAAPNQAPNANAGQDHNITLPTSSITANGSGTDPDGTIVEFQWTKISGPAAGTIVSPAQAQTVINNLAQGTYRFELRVTDNQGASDRDTMTVVVNPANQAPTANAGPDHDITLPVNSITANGSGSDPDGIIAAYQWTKISGPTQFTITFPAQPQTIINNLVQGTYQFELRVTDNQGGFDRDTMTVTVNAAVPPPNQLPTANAGADHTITLPVNSVTAIGGGSDPDGIITAYQWTKISGPAQFTITFPTQPQTVINNLEQGTYQFELMVTDNQGGIDRDTMAVTVNAAVPPTNQPPVANAGLNHVITLPVSSVAVTGSGTDPDGTITAYQWTKVSGPAANILFPTQAQTVIENLVQGVYLFELMVTDNQGATDRDTMQVTVNPEGTPANEAPTANAGPDHNITLPVNSVTAMGSGSDPDGTITSYHWEKIAGPTQFTILFPTQAQTVINNLVEGTYSFELTVTDNQGAQARDTMIVVVNAAIPPANQSPVANAGPDHTITLPVNSVIAIGNGSDPDGIITAYQWTKIAGPAQFAILFPTQPQTVINNLVQGTYQFELMVTDNQGAIDRDTMTVVVNAAVPPPNQLPMANAGPDLSITLPTNSVTAIGSGTDPDGVITAYQWTKISGPSQFAILFPTQPQTIINNLVQGVYQFELMVTDNQGATDRDTMTVTVNPPPNQPPAADAGTDKVITLPTNSVTQVGSGTDPDGTIVSYQWTRVSGPTQYVIISPLLPTTVINNLVQGVYRFELMVTDNQGATDRDTVTITVLAAPPPNQAPVANAGPDHTITLPVTSVTANGSGSDPDGSIVAYQWTKLSGPAQFAILFPSQPQTVINNLVQGVYEFELRVTDNQGAVDRDTMIVTVNAGPPPPPNQAPVANAGGDLSITLPTNSITAMGGGTDADGTIVAYQWTKLTGPNQFSILFPAQGQTVINNLVEGVYTFELRVTDNQGASDRDTMTVTVNPAPPPPNQPPTAIAGADTSITLPLNHILINGAGVDADGMIVSYSWTKISGPSQYLIADPSLAQTEFRNLVAGVYEFELTVTDDDGAIDRDTIMITVNENPNRSSKAMIYPNPATDQINIRIEAITYANKTVIQIMSISGVIVYQKEVMRTQQMVVIPVDVTTLPRGSYFVKVGLDLNNAITLPFIKQ